MSTRAICDLAVSWEILDNRSLLEVTKVIIDGQVRTNRDVPLTEASANHGNQSAHNCQSNQSSQGSQSHPGNHSNQCNHVSPLVRAPSKDGPGGGGKVADGKARETGCSSKMLRHQTSKSGPIHLHPFMHPELIDPACCELRILCTPRHDLRITSIELTSNAKHLEYYDSLGEFLHSVRPEATADRDGYLAKCTLDRNVFEVNVKFFSLLDAKCLTIGSLSVALEHFEWPKESPTMLGKSQAASQNALGGPLSQSASAVTGFMSPTFNLQRMLQTGNRLSNANPSLACARSSSHGVLSGILTAPQTQTACSTPHYRPAAPTSAARVNSPPRATDCGPHLKRLAESRFNTHPHTSAAPPSTSEQPMIPRCASDAVDRAPKRSVPPVPPENIVVSDARRFSEPFTAPILPQSQNGDSCTSAGNEEAEQRATGNCSGTESDTRRSPRDEKHDALLNRSRAAQLELFVFELTAALYSDLAEHVDRRLEQLEARLSRQLDERLSRPLRPVSPAASTCTTPPTCNADQQPSTAADRLRI